jgi:transposase-like protein
VAELTDKYLADEGTDIEERASREDAEEKAIEEIDKLYWYNSGIVKLYLKHGNYRAIEEDTGIPYSSAYKTIQKSFQEIRQKVLG